MKMDESIKWRDEEALRRFQIISPMIGKDVDRAKRNVLIEKAAEENGISVRTIQRYIAAYKEGGFSALRPVNRNEQISSRLPSNYDDILKEAIQLKKEVQTRSVEQIIFILECEGKAPPGVLKRSTLQRYLFKAGFGKKQMKKYLEGQKGTTSRRFCKPHRMMLVQADIKYGVGIVYKSNGKKYTAYLSSVIDDHSRYILASEWYDNQREYVVEDVFRKAILKNGHFDVALVDNGKQYVSKQLRISCSKLGIRIHKCQIYSGWQKGKIEKFHQIVDDFIAEVKLKKPKSLSEINHYWDMFLEEYYQKKPHEGIREYYKSNGIDIPQEGISPQQEWNRDDRPLVFIDTQVVAEAFQYHTTRYVDKGGCISFKGKKYEVSASLIGAQVEVAYDPNDFGKITIRYNNMEPMEAKPVEIGSYCSKTPPIPQALQKEEPATSRFLDALEKKAKESHKKQADAISYGMCVEQEDKK